GHEAVVDLGDREAMEQGMGLAEGLVVFGEEDLVKLLAGPEADDFEFGQRPGPELSGETGGKVYDPHRLAHVEDEHLAVPADRPGLEDELDRLGDRHEVTGDV